MKKTNKTTKKNSRNRWKKDGSQAVKAKESIMEASPLEEVFPEDLREAQETQTLQPDNTNWSQAQDRSEDLINETDPFIQPSD